MIIKTVVIPAKAGIYCDGKWIPAKSVQVYNPALPLYWAGKLGMAKISYFVECLFLGGFAKPIYCLKS